MTLMCLCLTSCKEHFSDGERVGTVTKFSKGYMEMRKHIQHYIKK